MLILQAKTSVRTAASLSVPVIRWQRRDTLHPGADDPAFTELARTRALKMPYYRTLISVCNWFLGSVVFIIASWPVASRSAPFVLVASALGATATAIIGTTRTAIVGLLLTGLHCGGIARLAVLTNFEDFSAANPHFDADTTVRSDGG